jgi:hypothetical protein
LALGWLSLGVPSIPCGKRDFPMTAMSRDPRGVFGDFYYSE